MEAIQIRPAGRRVLSKTNFWQLTHNGRVIGWASSYPAAQAKASALAERRSAS